MANVGTSDSEQQRLVEYKQWFREKWYPAVWFKVKYKCDHCRGIPSDAKWENGAWHWHCERCDDH